MAEVIYGANAFGFWAKEAPEYLADERVKSRRSSSRARSSSCAIGRSASSASSGRGTTR